MGGKRSVVATHAQMAMAMCASQGPFRVARRVTRYVAARHHRLSCVQTTKDSRKGR